MDCERVSWVAAGLAASYVIWDVVVASELMVRLNG
tara:strand:+ start:111 stop:215 length:105 start_codon:yes stop_codon:yes gene_type:complete